MSVTFVARLDEIRGTQETADDVAAQRHGGAMIPRYFRVAHCAIWTGPTSVLVPLPAGLKTEASPSRISNQSLPNAARMFGLRVTLSVFVAGSRRRAARPARA